jgi:hypothetical protein
MERTAVGERRRISGITIGAGAALVLFAVQFSAIAFAPSETWVRIALPLTIAIAPFALWSFRGHVGTWIIVVGLCANLAAVLANGGLMPISVDTVEAAVGEERAAEYEAGAWIPGSKDVLLESGEGRLMALGDRIVVRFAGGGMAASAGDVVIAAGMLALIGEAVAVRALRSRREEVEELQPVEEQPRLAA